MSHTILQSTKIYQLVDLQGHSVVIAGVVGSSNNVSPRSYNRIHFYKVTDTMQDMAVEGAVLAEEILTGGIVLKNGNGISNEDDVITLERRFDRNLWNSKIIKVESIEFNDGAAKITFGEIGFRNLRMAAPSFIFAEWVECGSAKFSMTQATEADHQALWFIKGKRTIAEAVKLSETNSMLPAIFEPQDITEEQLAILVKNCSEYIYPEIASRTKTRLSKAAAEAISKNEKKDSWRFERYIACLTQA